jgi:hypothetical protein
MTFGLLRRSSRNNESFVTVAGVDNRTILSYAKIGKPNELLRILRRLAQRRGLRFEVQEGGNHTKLRFGDAQTVIGRHAKDLKTGTLAATLKQLGLTKADLEE